MVNLVPLKNIFDIEYGNKFDKNKMSLDDGGVNFVSRSSKDLGFDGKVARATGIKPYEKGLITVTLGGTYLLSSFVQPEPFYAAQNIKVLTPKQEMSFKQKVFYCYVIGKNRFRYTSHGREANKTLDEMLVPSRENIPSWVEETKVAEIDEKPVLSNNSINLDPKKWKSFPLKDLFEVKSSGDPQLMDLEEGGKTPYISSTKYDNGVASLVRLPASNNSNVLTINSNGSVGRTFYQPKDFLVSKTDVRILTPRLEINQYIGLFLTTVISNEKQFFDYGRKMGTARLKKLQIKLPSTPEGNPDWKFMEDYIKSLPYSSNL